MPQNQTQFDPTDAETFLVGKNHFSLKDNQLRNENGEHLPLRSQASEVLACLIRDNGHIVSKDKLHDVVWGDAIVTDDSLVQCIGEIRRALNDKDHRIVQTFQRKGYLVNAEPASAVKLSKDLGANDGSNDRGRRKWPLIAGALRWV